MILITICSKEKITMTKQEYDKVIKIIDSYMTILHESTYSPRLVLTTFGFSKVKEELKTLIKEKK